MKTALTTLSILFSVFMSNQAVAGFMIEPYLGYESGTLTGTQITPAMDVGGTGNSVTLGARVGWKFFGFWAALDYMMANAGKASPSSALAGDVTYTKNEMGLALGYDFPIKLRAYATYNFSPTWKQTMTSAEYTYSGGTNWKLGFGYSLIMWLTANLEYYSNTPAKRESSGSSVDVSTLMTTYTETGYRLVFSFPFSL